MVVGVLTHYTLLYFEWDLKAIQMNVQHSLIYKLMLYEFELGHNAAMEATKTFAVQKMNMVTRCYKKILLEAKSSWPKTMDSELQARETNSESIRQT